MGLPSMGDRSDVQVYSLRALEEKYGDRIEFVYPKDYVQRMFHDYARNKIVDDFLESNCDVLWFLDADVAPPPHVLDLITEHSDKWQAAGAVYPVFMTPAGREHQAVVMCVYKKNDIGLYAANCPQSGTEFVAGLATGCMFLKRSALEGMVKPYFEFKFKEDDRHLQEGEDLGFCRKLAERGIEFFTDYSMSCRHYKRVDLLAVNNYAIEFANNSVMNYDAAIRPKIEALIERARPKPKSSLILP